MSVVTVVRCDRCRSLVDSPPPEGGMTAGYYHGWKDFTNVGEEDVCDACMWADPRYTAVYGNQIPSDATLRRRIEAMIDLDRSRSTQGGTDK